MNIGNLGLATLLAALVSLTGCSQSAAGRARPVVDPADRVSPEPDPITSGCAKLDLAAAVARQLHTRKATEITIARRVAVHQPQPACAFTFFLYTPIDVEGDDDEEGAEDEEEPEAESGSGGWVVDLAGNRLAEFLELEDTEFGPELMSAADFDGDGIDELLLETSVYYRRVSSILHWNGSGYDSVLDHPLRDSPDGTGEEEGSVACVDRYEISPPDAGGKRLLVLSHSIEAALGYARTRHGSRSRGRVGRARRPSRSDRRAPVPPVRGPESHSGVSDRLETRDFGPA